MHRDIKPSNLILAREGNKPVVKILDFGLAKVTSESGVDGGLTYEGQMLGTPHYVAPEQTVNAQKADIRADIYSLGCTLYCLLVGHPPFDAPSLYELLQAHHSMDAKPLNFIRPEAVGINVIDGCKRYGDEWLDQDIYLMENEELAVNINTVQELQLAERLLPQKT